MRPFAFALTLTLLATVPAVAAERSRRNRSATENAAPTAAELRTALAPTAQQVAAVEAEPNTFRRSFLLEVAARMARDLGRIPEQRIDPVLSYYLRDLDDRPSALVVLYALDPEGASFDRLADLAARHRRHVRKVAAADDYGDTPWTVDGGDRYLTVIVGASPYAPRLVLLSRTPGLFIWRPIARQRVADVRGVKPRDASVVRPFYEPRMPYVRSLGFVVRTGGRDSLYFPPSHSDPRGTVVSLDEMRRRRTALRLRRLEQAGGSTGAPPRPARQAGPQPKARVSLPTAAASARATDAMTAAADVAAWGKMAAAVGEDSLARICADCAAFDEPVFNGGVYDRFDDLVNLDGCECEKVWEDGSRHPVASCDDFPDACCQWQDGEYLDTGNCLTHCICDCPYEEEYSDKTEYGKLIKGVPIFFQHTVESERESCPDQVAVGCVPTGFTELFVWWDQLGYEQLTEDFRSGDDKVQWKRMSKTLRNDYYNGRCTDDGQTSVPGLSKKKKGTKKYLGETSYGYVFEADKYKSRDEWTAYELIEDEIRDNRPIGLSYCPVKYNNPGADSCDDGEIDDGWAHFALIVGYENYNYGNFVHINNGWGGNQAAVYEWEIPDQDVALYRFEITSPRDGSTWCGADDLGAYFATTTAADGKPSIGYTFQPSEFDSLTEEAVITGATCRRLEVAQTETWVETGTYHTDLKCFTPAIKGKLDRAIEEGLQEMEDRGGTLDWIWE